MWHAQMTRHKTSTKDGCQVSTAALSLRGNPQNEKYEECIPCATSNSAPRGRRGDRSRRGHIARHGGGDPKRGDEQRRRQWVLTHLVEG